MRFNPPPNWPVPPAGWQPPPDWRPDPRWGPPPPGWPLWIEDGAPGAKANGGAKFSGMIKHPVWTSVGTVVGVLALVVTAAGFLRDGEQPGRVEIGGIAIGSAEPITATGKAPGLGEIEPVTNYTAAPIDITLTNTGDTPVHVVRITAEPEDSLNWACQPRGGGLAITANYSVTLPTRFVDEKVYYLAERASAPVDFTVKANSSDRMVVTVGPQGGLEPYVFFSTLHLETDDGGTVVTPPLAVVTPTEVDSQLRIFSDPEKQAFPGFRECLSDYLGAVESMTPEDAVRSPEFDRWIDGLQAIDRS